MPSIKTPIITILVPVYNEEKTIYSVLNKVTKLPLDNYEVIVVNDGSTDRSNEIISNFIDSFDNKKVDIKYIKHDKNHGKGAGIKTGLLNAKGKYFTIQDADLEYDPTAIPKLVKKAVDNDLDVVYGSRFLGNIKNMPLANFYANRFYNFLLRRFYNTKITDMHTCYKMVNTKLLKDLKIEANGFNYAPELVSKLLLREIEIVEVPINFNGRTKAEGKKIGIKDGFECVNLLFKYKAESSKGLIGSLYKERVVASRYALIGSVGFIANYTALMLLTKYGLNRVIAEVLAVAFALQVTFIFHDKWTYKHKTLSYKRSLFSRYRTYLVSNSLGAIITVIFFALFSIVFNHLISLALASLVGLFWNYVLNKFVVWKHITESADKN